MRNLLAALIASGLAIGSTASAQVATGADPSTLFNQSSFEGPAERVALGYGRLFNNDLFGDGRDRWQTVSFTASTIVGDEWTGEMPSEMGSLIEYRFQTKIVAPGDVENPVANDRLYSTSVSLGAHTHFALAGGEMSVGGDLVVTGPMTGLIDLQTTIHNVINRDIPSTATIADMIPNGVHPSLVFEYGRPLSLNGLTEVRPFAELRTGDETLIRSGVDFYFGGVQNSDLLVRDQVTGQRYRSVRGDTLPGYGFVIGGDFAAMSNSIYLPSRGPTMIDNRTRLRAGMLWQGDQNSVYYGMTWLSKEFETQEDAQVVGSLRLNFEF